MAEPAVNRCASEVRGELKAQCEAGARHVTRFWNVKTVALRDLPYTKGKRLLHISRI
jgi:hypothetical protein